MKAAPAPARAGVDQSDDDVRTRNEMAADDVASGAAEPGDWRLGGSGLDRRRANNRT